MNMLENSKTVTGSGMTGSIAGNGILTQIYKGEKFTFWYDANVVRPHILDFLIKEYPGTIIIPEFNYTDIVVTDENIPVEIQSTVISHPGKGGQGLMHSEFENKIVKQLVQNIGRYSRCIFFFDSEYLRYLQTLATKNTRVNLDWFYNYVKEGKLTVFAVKYDGTIIPTTLKDFEFILKISTLREQSVLDKNKFKIMSRVLRWKGFSTKEVNDLYNKFKLSVKVNSDDKNFRKWLCRKGCTEREFELMYAYNSVQHLDQIDSMLSCDITDEDNMRTISRDAQKLGLIDSRDTGKTVSAGYMRIFTDYSNIAELFPGYVNNKELWDDLKTRYVSYNTLCGIVMKKVDINWWKKQPKSIEDAWNR